MVIADTPAPPLTHHRALVLIRERLNELDAIEHVPLHIQADLEQLLVEAIDIPENSPCAVGDYNEGIEEGIEIGRSDERVRHAQATILERAAKVAKGAPSVDADRFSEFLMSCSREARETGTISAAIG